MDYNQLVLKHLQNFWSNHQIQGFTWNLGRITSELPDFHIFRISPNQPNEPWVYVSSGIGAFHGLEFFIISPFETPEHIETLAMLASACVHNPEYFQLGRVVNIGRPWIEQSELNNFLISLPYPYGEKLEYSHKVRFLWLLPISLKEKEFLVTHSVEDLENIFDRKGIDFLDINRASVI